MCLSVCDMVKIGVLQIHKATFCGENGNWKRVKRKNLNPDIFVSHGVPLFRFNSLYFSSDGTIELGRCIGWMIYWLI